MPDPSLLDDPDLAAALTIPDYAPEVPAGSTSTWSISPDLINAVTNLARTGLAIYTASTNTAGTSTTSVDHAAPAPTSSTQQQQAMQNGIIPKIVRFFGLPVNTWTLLTVGAIFVGLVVFTVYKVGRWIFSKFKK